MITQQFLPKPLVIASHIWKRAWHMVCRKYMEFDVNDNRNGLLLFKPFEWAFDNSKICFIPDGLGPGGEGNFVMHILDGGIKEVGIVDKLEEIEANRKVTRGLSYVVRARAASPLFVRAHAFLPACLEVFFCACNLRMTL
jgi:hypothetical protein